MTVDIGLVKYVTDEEDSNKFTKVLDYFKRDRFNIKFNILIYDNSSNNIGLIKARNILLSMSKSDYICFMDFDLDIINIEWEDILEKFRSDETIGIISPISKGASSVDNTLRWQKKEYLACNFMIFSKKVFSTIGKFDEDFFVYHGDWDIIKRTLDNNFIVLQDNKSIVKHYMFSRKHSNHSLIWKKDYYTFIKKYKKPLNRKLI